jgi:hypothetical protein
VTKVTQVTQKLGVSKMRHLRHLRPYRNKIPFVANGEVADNLRIVRNFSVGKWVEFPESRADGKS